MKLENARKIQDYLLDQGVEVDLCENYSGRFMFGEETAGLILDEPGEITAAMRVLKIKDSNRVDNMARQFIVY